MKRLIIAAAMTAMMAASPVWANATTAADQANAVARQESTDAVQIAQQGQMALRDIQLARLALFHGHPDKAVILTNQAASLLADDSTDWNKFVRTDKKATLVNDKYVAIDATMSISEDYIASPEKQAAIKRANTKMAHGDKKGAMDELRLAGIGVTENLCLMPLKQTQKIVAKAQGLLKDQKYYEANLALKGAEDGVVIDSSSMFDN